MSAMDWYYKKLLPKRVKMGHKYTMATENTVGTQPTDNQQIKGAIDGSQKPPVSVQRSNTYRKITAL